MFMVLNSGDAPASLNGINTENPIKILRIDSNAPLVCHKDLKIPYHKDVITEMSVNHHIKLENDTNIHLSPLQEIQNARRLKNEKAKWSKECLRKNYHWRRRQRTT